MDELNVDSIIINPFIKVISFVINKIYNLYIAYVSLAYRNCFYINLFYLLFLQFNIAKNEFIY